MHRCDQSTCMNTNSITPARTSQFLFFFSSLCTSSIQPISFFFHYFSTTSYICTTQPAFESSLESTFHDSFDLFLVLGMTLHIVKMTTQKSKVLGCVTITTQNLILILTSGRIVHSAVTLAVHGISLTQHASQNLYMKATAGAIEKQVSLHTVYCMITKHGQL